MLAIFQYILTNKAFVCNTYYSINRNYLEHFLYDRAYDLIKPVLKAKNPDLSASELDFRVHFYKYGLVGFILDWIDSGLQENPDTLAKRIYQLLNHWTKSAKCQKFRQERFPVYFIFSKKAF